MALSPDTNYFDLLRKQNQTQLQGQNQQEQEALKRRFASLGNVNSGAYISSAGDLEQKQGQRLDTANAQVDVQEAQTLEQRKQIEQAQKYATGEREAGQQFQSQEAATQRGFTKELSDQDLNFRKDVANQQFGFAQKEFEESQRANLFNSLVALKTSGFTDQDLQGVADQLSSLQLRFSRGPSGELVLQPPSGGGQGGGMSFDEQLRARYNKAKKEIGFDPKFQYAVPGGFDYALNQPTIGRAKIDESLRNLGY